ncbi:probable dolichyl pyrophosphate Man9GlcNAc2 alpha-1,3-glucosyltransferase isoform X1 [Neocloeon triangulifer]|uniref:probable dolichyl pyrophosphate Man9GlcNAc2 alpha-1,3-glucosyltransferase isoform X1 n=1 Tax=Neocloeon triangulifer TaxID=2078957 RepID=UPI00286F6159|nr:probable dolichyl pyrophosphate Man9GlcNAc2 alpha-1,3-glucosyltransferase isoform X1 [Neocloeon triangulifer]
MVLSCESLKKKIAKELNASHVVAGASRRSESSVLRGFSLLMVVVGLVVRWTVAVGPHSGQNRPPLFGDYEAQRHWQEVTVNLPLTQWYTNSSANDLEYWGLDYPPLTAYHSWALGRVARVVQPRFVDLHTSRGVEDDEHRLFMRASVLLAELAFHLPPLVLYLKELKTNPVLAVLYPGLILVDHGHFQYNCVSLGLTLAAVVALKRRRLLLGSFFFSLAVNYKQMSLYHSLPFFSYLLGLCLRQPSWSASISKLLKIATTVVLTFGLVWAPFFFPNPANALQVLHRIFPVARGLYEDKVSSFWCAISVVVKVQQILPRTWLTILCLVTTLVSVLPSNLKLLRKPNTKNLVLSLFISSLGFFLFSYHVHEKSILLPAMAAMLMLPHHPIMATWFLATSTYSLLPLMVKDDLVLPWLSLLSLFLAIGAQMMPPLNSGLLKWALRASLGASVILVVAQALVTAPVRYPHLFPQLNSIFCCGHFLVFLAYAYWLQFRTEVKQHAN